MNKRVYARVSPVIGVALMALGVGIFVSGPNESRARTASQFELGDAGDDILKLAEAIKTDNQAAIKQLTKSLAKREYIEDGIMTVFKPRSKGGLGVGREKGKVTPDGIDLKLQAISLAAPSGAVLGREGPALEEMAYIMAAVAEVAALKGPPEGKQKNDWANWIKEMKETSIALAKAVKAKDGADVKAVANKLNNNCAACHAIFKK